MTYDSQTDYPVTSILFGAFLIFLIGAMTGAFVYEKADYPSNIEFQNKVEFKYPGDSMTIEANTTHAPNQTCYRNYMDGSFDVKEMENGDVVIMKTWDNGKKAFFGDVFNQCIEAQ